MAGYVIPITADEPHQRFEVDLEGATFVLVLDWNQREGFWYASLELPDGTQLLDGRKVVLGVPMFRRLTDPRRPPGDLVFIDTSGADLEAGRLDLGTRVVAVYLDRADIDALIEEA